MLSCKLTYMNMFLFLFYYKDWWNIISNCFLWCFKSGTLKKIRTYWKYITTNKKVSEPWKSTLLPWKLVTTQFFNHDTRYFLIKVWRCWWSVEDVTNSQLFIQSKLLINHFRSMFYFYTPWKRQKIWGFLTFSRGIEIGHYPEIC